MTSACRKGNISLELNYSTIEDAKRHSHPLWIRQSDDKSCSESIELTLEQAKWLKSVLEAYIKILS